MYIPSMMKYSVLYSSLLLLGTIISIVFGLKSQRIKMLLMFILS